MKTINELQDEVIEEFSDFDDWMDKYQLLIDLGNEQVPLDPQAGAECADSLPGSRGLQGHHQGHHPGCAGAGSDHP